jgi:hypothetical protein
MITKKKWLSVRLILVAAVAIVMIVFLPFISCQQELWGSDGILFEFEGGGITREPATETVVQIGIAHTCMFNDELMLEKVEIYGESGIPVKSLAVNRTLNSIFWKKILLEPLVKLVAIPIAGFVFYPVAGELYEEVRAEVFSTGYYTIDLRQIKQPLTYGDIPIIAKATLIHNGKRVTLERELIVEYQVSLLGGQR